MPRNKEQNQEIRRQRQETIIRAALKVYAEKGYSASEINDVAEQAGVARGLIYYYFKDKHALFRELFLIMLKRSNEHIQAHFDQDGSVVALLESFVRTMYINILEQSDSILFFMRMRHDLHELFTPEELKTWSWHHDNMSVVRKMLDKGMKSGEIRQMSPQLLTVQYWGAMMHGVMHLRQSHQELLAQGVDKKEIEQSFQRDIHDAVAGCMLLVTSLNGQNSIGVDKE
ncbi:TetR/AcrR family transcriptional regulator [Paenibacillus piri]|uniref:TetR/AcrR family transcriptional regulator n=1 Tax=Paenibacillus piri TaxID=2547395 RepID=A0A4R5KKM5_9BACL|nr:TetR/AcrR family transcriptional regulator [Paenibacillus piri]TDF95067.1 TetR/AcrR family transcriptional regulator [Paenibacillus piri]